MPGHLSLETFSGDMVNSQHSLEVEIQFCTPTILGKREKKGWGMRSGESASAMTLFGCLSISTFR